MASKTVKADSDRAILSIEDFHEKVREDRCDESRSVLVRRGLTDHVCGINTKNRTIDFIISTESVDRMGDTIALDGWDLRAYRKNPVVLFGHNHSAPPIAKATRVWRDRKAGALKATASFVPADVSPFAETVFQLFKGGFMRATSVGFVPIKWERTEEEGRPFGIDFLAQELIEFSVVPVPANSEALVDGEIKTMPMRKWILKSLDEARREDDFWRLIGASRKDAERMLKVLGEPEGKTFFRVPSAKSRETRKENLARLRERAQQLAKEAEDMSLDTDLSYQDMSVEKERSAITYASAHKDGTKKAPKDESWDGPKQVAAADIDDLRVMCTWRADKDGDELTKGDFKLPHHKASSGHAVVWRGVAAAAARLPNTDIPESDVAGVQQHLGKHYKEFDEEPPWSKDAAGWDLYVGACHDKQTDVARGVADELFGTEISELVWPKESDGDVAVDEPVTDTVKDTDVDQTDLGDRDVDGDTVIETVTLDAIDDDEDQISVVTDDLDGDDTEAVVDSCDGDQGDPVAAINAGFERALLVIEDLMDLIEDNPQVMATISDSRSGLRAIGNMLGTCLDMRALLEQHVEVGTEKIKHLDAPTGGDIEEDKSVIEITDDEDETSVDIEGMECESDLKELVQEVLRGSVAAIVDQEVRRVAGHVKCE